MAFIRPTWTALQSWRHRLARAVLIVDEGDGGRGSGANVQWDRS